MNGGMLAVPPALSNHDGIGDVDDTLQCLCTELLPCLCSSAFPLLTLAITTCIPCLALPRATHPLRPPNPGSSLLPERPLAHAPTLILSPPLPPPLPPPPTVAGKIAHSLRAREWPTLLVAGNSSIHAAVKCCITAGRFVQQEGLAVQFEPFFRDADHSRALLALRVLQVIPGTPAAASATSVAAAAAAASAAAAAGTGAEAGGAAAGAQQAGASAPLEVKVSAHSRHAKVGAALSARLTEHRRNGTVILLALGETAMANAVMATAHAAHYLRAQQGLRLMVQAHEATVIKDGDHLTGVQLWVRIQKEGAEGDEDPADGGGPGPSHGHGSGGGAGAFADAAASGLSGLSVSKS